jgi:hypothetical protein
MPPPQIGGESYVINNGFAKKPMSSQRRFATSRFDPEAGFRPAEYNRKLNGLASFAQSAANLQRNTRLNCIAKPW